MARPGNGLPHFCPYYIGQNLVTEMQESLGNVVLVCAQEENKSLMTTSHCFHLMYHFPKEALCYLPDRAKSPKLRHLFTLSFSPLEHLLQLQFCISLRDYLVKVCLLDDRMSP